MAGKHRNTNIPKGSIKKGLTLSLSPQADRVIMEQSIINKRSYASQVEIWLEEAVKMELQKETSSSVKAQ